MNLIQTNGIQTMNSREIAELVEKRHDNVKRTIETLIERGVIESPQIEEIPTQTKPVAVYVFSGEQGKRDSIIVVAQLCPEFTARLVDRWQELEAQVAAPAQLTRMQLIEIALQAETERLALEAKATVLEARVTEQAPKIEALERFSDQDGKHNIRNSAKLLGVPERKLISWLLTHDWFYRDHSGRLCAKSVQIATGYLDTIPVPITRSDGVQTVAQPVITQRGLAKLGELLARDGMLPKPSGITGRGSRKFITPATPPGAPA